MVRMVKVFRQSLSFCKYVIASLLWLAIIFQNIYLVWAVFAIVTVSTFTGVDKAPLILIFNPIAKKIKAEDFFINKYSMRFAHIVAAIFSAVSIILYYVNWRIPCLILVCLLALLQSIAALGFCSAQKLYECVICNNNCCNLGNRIKRLKKNVR